MIAMYYKCTTVIKKHNIYYCSEIKIRITVMAIMMSPIMASTIRVMMSNVMHITMPIKMSPVQNI